MDIKKIQINRPSKQFWYANAAGWGFAAVINFILQLYPDNSDIVRAIVGVFPMIAGFVVTTGMRYYWGAVDLYSRSTKHLVISLIPHSFTATVFIVVFGIGGILLIQNYNGNITRLFIANFLNLYLIVLVWISAYFFIVYSYVIKQKEIDNLRLLNSLQSAELVNLRSQLNPHFLFNALNNIRSLINEDTEKARTMITSVTDILRYSLSSRKEHKVLLSDEIAFVREYLNLEHLHMEERLRYNIDVETDTLKIFVPPMAVQLLAENAIKHGLSKLPNGGELNITAKMDSDKLKIIVCNTGALHYINTSPGVGIANIKERINLLYGKDAEFTITQNDNYVNAVLILPAVEK